MANFTTITSTLTTISPLTFLKVKPVRFTYDRSRLNTSQAS